jgi:hypothetical protein
VAPRQLESARSTCLLIALIAIVLPADADRRIEARRAGNPAAIHYRLERVDTRHDTTREFTRAQLAVLEKLNRADVERLRRLPQLVIPDVWCDELQYSPFPAVYPGAAPVPKLLLVDVPAQAFAAYEQGRLVRWGPVSSGRAAYPTPSGVFLLNWRTLGRHSSENPEWYMDWYFNFESTRGLALHHYALPGYPASHACIRLLDRDAIWIYGWGNGWTLDVRGRVVQQGTPLIVSGQYAFGTPPPWRSLERLAQGIALPKPPMGPGG